jgi:UPF0716 protein FxsA
VGRGLAVAPLALAITIVLEIAVFVLLGGWIGYVWAVLLVLALSGLGLALLRREGVRAWRRFRVAAEAGERPGTHVTDGLVGLLGALLLAVPGLITGAIGVVMLAPPGRQVVRSRLQRTAERRLSPTVVGEMFGPRRVRVRRAPRSAAPHDDAGGPPQPPGPVVEGEIVEPDDH